MAEYRRELTRNTLIWKDTFACDRDGYQVRMITRVHIPGLLACRCQMVDGELYYYYDATDYQPFLAVYSGKNIQKSDMENLLYAIQKIQKGVREYLLDPSAILLDPEYIFITPDKSKYGFCYVPGRSVNLEEAFGTLATFFLENLDHDQKEAVILGYGIYRKIKEGQACLEQVMSLLEDHGEPITTTESQTAQIQENIHQKPEQKIKKKRKNTFQGRGILLVLFGITAGIAACINKGMFPGLVIKENHGIRIETGTKTMGVLTEGSRVWIIVLIFVLAGTILFALVFRHKKKSKNNISKTEPSQRAFEVSDPTVFLPSVFSEKERKLISVETQEEFLMTGGQFTVGKVPEMGGLAIPADTVSRKHACFIFQNGEWYVEDCSSSNGTFVNGNRLEVGDRLQLMQGDEVCFADKTYLYL